jgi:hypothetical protein
VIKWVILVSLLTSQAIAADHYNIYANNGWKTKFRVNNNLIVKSKYKLPKHKRLLLIKIYKQTEEKFFVFTGINPTSCVMEKGIIHIVSENDLDNQSYFPRERRYSLPESGLYVLGRYFRYTNNLYIVPPNLSEYYWRKNFSHEVLHYLYDSCKVEFDKDEEHEQIHKFLSINSMYFY